MDVALITMDKDAAKTAFLAYQAEVRADRGKARKAWASEDRALMHAHKALSKGQAVINLEAAIKFGGVFPSGESMSAGFPKLAVCRADEHQCRVVMNSDGSAVFQSDRGRWGRPGKSERTAVPADTFPRWTHLARLNQAVTPVPIVPPPLRPKFNLGNYHTLWEVESWSPVPPRDPMLLKHLGGALYVVLGTWDLSDIERAVLSQTNQ